MPRASRISWSHQQMDKLKKAVDYYNHVLDKLESRQDIGYYDYIPARTSLDFEMHNIYTREDLKRRLRELRKISDTSKQEPIEFRGHVVPLYLKEEILNYERAINRKHEDVKDTIYNWEEMTPQQQSMAIARGNISRLEGNYYTGEDLSALQSQYYAETDNAYFEKYIAEWHKYCVVKSYEEEVVDNIEWLMANRPGALRFILEEGDSEAQIEYIYEWSADFTNIATRHSEIVRFWARKRLEYSAGE